MEEFFETDDEKVLMRTELMTFKSYCRMASPNMKKAFKISG
jgi:hypothetical protein